MSFLLSFVGFIVLVAGLAALATAFGLSQTFVLIGAGVLLAFGLVAGVSRSRV